MRWSVGFLDEVTKAALDALPLDIRASFQRIVELIQDHGLDRVREPYLKHLDGPLWEMRLKGKSGMHARFMSPQLVCVSSSFMFLLRKPGKRRAAKSS